MIRSSLLAIIIAVILGINITYGQRITPKADHHLHIRSEASSSALVKLQKALSGEDMEPLDPTGADDVIQLLDEAGIEKGVLLSLAYFFGVPDVEFENEYDQVKAENDYVINEASKYPDRLVAFCSVNPLADYALKEIKRCADNEKVAGVKLHLANSNIDLQNSDHVQSLADLFSEMEQLSLGVVVHLFTRNPEYGYKDAKIFIDKILEKVPELNVQIAHLAGPGFFNETTKSALRAFEEAIDQKPDLMDEDVVFDVSATVRDPEVTLAQGDTTGAEQIRANNKQVAEYIQKIGSKRIVFGTDWIGGSREPANYANIFRSIPLDRNAVKRMFAPAPYIAK